MNPQCWDVKYRILCGSETTATGKVRNFPVGMEKLKQCQYLLQKYVP